MTRRTPSAEQPKKMLDRSWHLARTPQEMDVAELEYALIRCFEAFGHWQAECLASVADFSASGPENALLHMIRMNDRPKSVRDLAHMANRQDIPNIQYSLRKLIKGGLVVRSGSGRSGVTYDTTERGRDVCDRYADVRADLLIDPVTRLPDLAERLRDAARALDLMTGIYEHAARGAATHRHRPGGAPQAPVKISQGRI
ncbi:winged helix DNA-binding protein [Mesorhizobium sp. LHD-90]|uniref:winged helix DNA-binding protein n=1 Tax=Mesorhizobium sp. LHD-90 TaxID=3071414 RepID=UPI0027DF7286|nr:winged helix DNA-binding protein [Mesorhizobium sp. LHD-90]MDQ6436096.1 winged helix DNA-binding protein [Mesorhizobium sp. LHD-90]